MIEIYKAKVVGYGSALYIHLPKKHFKKGEQYMVTITDAGQGKYEVNLIKVV
jgi:hypothetical protein